MQTELDPAFAQFPADSRAWVYVAPQPLQAQQEELLNTAMAQLMATWNAHGTRLHAAWQLLHGQVLVLAANEAMAAASGCSIDASVAVLRQHQQATGLDWLNRAWVVHAQPGQRIALAPLAQAKQLVASGAIGPHTLVLNLGVATVGQLHQQLWQPAAQSWMGRHFSAQPA